MSIKRYDLERDVHSSCYCDVEEADLGDYVLYEDIVEHLESTIAENMRLRKDLKLSLQEIENYQKDL